MLKFRKFQREDYTEYASWFADAELNRQLGPMDEEWLEAVLHEPASAGVTWVVLQGDEMVAVIGISFDASSQLPIGINAIAVKPARRKQGIGTAALQKMLAHYQATGQFAFVAYLSAENPAAQRYVIQNGFSAVTNLPDEHGFIEFRTGQSESDERMQ